MDGDQNVFTYILTSFLKGYRSEAREVKRMCRVSIIENIVQYHADTELIWPEIFKIADE